MQTRFNRGLMAALLIGALGTTACDEDSPTGPMAEGMITADLATLAFGEVDVAFGASLPLTVSITNTGSGVLTVSDVVVAGTDAGAFAIVEGEDLTSLAVGASHEFMVSFDPAAAGVASAALRIVSDAPDQGSFDVALAGEGAIYTYTQVDRIGIPALNTVFNHPPAFSKLDYNTAGPADDVASYTSLFETVLGAVANADPSATAALLLPDELPVGLASAESNFAALNGRKPSDDATDIALSVVVGITALHSDNVDANDKAFLNDFPYFATPHN